MVFLLIEVYNKSYIFLKEVLTILFNYYQKQKELESEILTIRNILNTLPSGKFICTQSDNRYKWYICESHKKTYLPKSEYKLAGQLAYKRYLELKLQELEVELKAVNNYISTITPPLKSTSLITDSPEFQKLISTYFTPVNTELAEWMQHPYDRNPYFSEGLVHKSISGNCLRSKSEAIIDMLLYQNKIPYRYECILQFAEQAIYPDFTIRHPISGKFFYWEHFGQMDNPEYYTKACSKIQFYISHGYIPSINLITTYETKNFPLTSETVQHIIEHYFL